MFWVCAENGVANTEMFLLSLRISHTESRPSLLLTLPHQLVGWGCRRRWEGTQAGQLTPPAPRDIPYHVTSCSAIKLGGCGLAGSCLYWGTGWASVCWW